MWGISPRASVWGQDLTPEQKAALGLKPTRLAFRQGDYVPPPAAKAGVHGGDIVLGINGLELEMTMLQFNAYVRLNYEVGDTVTLNLIRDGKPLNLSMTLEAQD
jgi:S1-C subfamily serine protease